MARSSRTNFSVTVSCAAALLAGALLSSALGAGTQEAAEQKVVNQRIAAQKLAALSNPSPERAGEARKNAAVVPNSVTPLKSRRICESGFDIQTGRFTTEDASAHDGAAAASVEMEKSCSGPVLVRFSSGVLAPGETDTVYVVLQAECVGHGTHAIHCVEGEIHLGSPDASRLKLAVGPQSGTDVHATQWIYPDLRPGIWRFTVRPASNGGNAVTLSGRGLSVAAFHG